MQARGRARALLCLDSAHGTGERAPRLSSIPPLCAMSLAAVPPRSAAPASAAIFTLQPENKAQMPEQSP